jgi:4,5-dihydroxyphthalate decarboxylase
VRAILQNEYGVDLDKVTWVTFDESHLSEYSDPPNCQRAPKGRKLVEMLLNGEVDAALLGGNMPDDPRIKRLIPDATAAAQVWWKKHGVVPINHMYVVKQSLCEARPDVVREIYRMLTASRAAGPQPAPGGPDMTPNGVAANRKPLEMVIDFALQQKVIPRKLSVDELFDDATRALGL